MMRWEQIKEQALLSLKEAIEKELADKEILPLLELINSKEGWVTSSSCAGRIVLIRKARRKEDSAFLFKWHRKISVSELREAIKSIGNRKDVFLRAESFILHVLCKDLEWAKALLSLARQGGIKKGGLQNLGEKLLVELRGNVNLSIPLECVWFEYDKMTSILNQLMDENERAREKFREMLTSSNFSQPL